MELRTNRERAELIGPDDEVIDPQLLDVPAELTTDLHEWARVVAAMQRADAPEDASAAVLVSRRGMQLADRLSAVLQMTVRYHDPLTGEVLFVDAAPEPPAPPQPVVEETPWPTGLTVSGLMAIVTFAAVLTLAITLSETSALLAIGANAVVTAGLAPSVWLARNVLIWRWVALGVAAGLALGWVGLLFVLL
ncbi:DUF2537 domain-containing protein [Kibdelosporangium philippinense]|uniref:DUF2537 domain-containing protein n=1 Tax=Kibdelosporangium philippinense TaxID=211113 RepID=A0ABS8ZMQ3_9PSEU|nr:DUF2537 domain-containing protein [Kibdelosporangium philippinense]MCE7009029.1 DUF2537 domain-containing protein [Kibdelosporangium philippinense]